MIHLEYVLFFLLYNVERGGSYLTQDSDKSGR
jgi:hypothetical protein